MTKFHFASIAFSCVTLLTYNALSSPIPIDFSHESEMVGFYASGHYNIGFPRFSPISFKYKVDENSEKELTLFTLKEENTEKPDFTQTNNFNTTQGYNPVYNRNYTGFSGAIGYSSSGLRLELEGAFTKFDIDKQIYFALCKDTTMKNNSDGNYIIAKNEGFRVIALTFNACYDTVIDNSSLIPSACIGIGQGITSFLGGTNIHTLFKAKLGLGFLISAKTIVFANGYYVKAKDNAFTNLSVQYPVELKNAPKHIDHLTAYFNPDNYGGELGLRFIL